MAEAEPAVGLEAGGQPDLGVEGADPAGGAARATMRENWSIRNPVEAA
jgi:hypothetical protein